jgi:hypothetical protein
VTQTARNDLDALVGEGLLVKSKIGKAYRYRPAGDLAERLKVIASRPD